MEHPDAIDGYGLRPPATYAGSYERDGTIVTLWTEDPERHLEALRSRGDGPVEAEQATYSLVTLRALRDRIVEDDESLAAEGIELAVAGVDVIENRVTVGAAHPLDQRARAFLQQRYGPALLVRPAAR